MKVRMMKNAARSKGLVLGRFWSLTHILFRRPSASSLASILTQTKGGVIYSWLDSCTASGSDTGWEERHRWHIIQEKFTQRSEMSASVLMGLFSGATLQVAYRTGFCVVSISWESNSIPPLRLLNRMSSCHEDFVVCTEGAVSLMGGVQMWRLTCFSQKVRVTGFHTFNSKIMWHQKKTK